MLSKKQKETLRNIQIFEIANEEQNGVAVVKNEEFIIPTPYDLLESVKKKILESGFSKVERVSPSAANCIIRVYQKTHYEYLYGWFFNMYGTFCFVKDGVNWISESLGNTFHLDYSQCIVGQWIFQDERVSFDTDFIDFYVKVS